MSFIWSTGCPFSVTGCHMHKSLTLLLQRWNRNFSQDFNNFLSIFPFWLSRKKLDCNNFFWLICQLGEATKDESDILKVREQFFVHVWSIYIHCQKYLRKKSVQIRDPNTSIRKIEVMDFKEHPTSNFHEIKNLFSFYENQKQNIKIIFWTLMHVCSS